MKIAVVAPTQMPARRANTIQVAKMTQAFCNLGHEVCLLCPTQAVPRVINPGDGFGWEEFADHYGLQVRFPVEWILARPRLRRYDYGLASIRRARGWGAELVYTRLPQCAAFASFFGLPVVFEIHDFPHGYIAPRLLRVFLRGKGKRRLVVISHALFDRLSANFDIPDLEAFTQIAPDGVDLERYEKLPKPTRARKTLSKKIPGLINRFTVGYTGNLYAGRGIELIVTMASHLPDINFLIVGGEPDSVSSLMESLKLKQIENVLVTGFIPNREIPLYQACCEALLMPYQDRVQASSGGDIAAYLSPMKVFEYLACGRVIISSDLAVLREVLDNTNAILLPPDDINAWVETLKMVQVDKATRDKLSTSAHETARQYSWESRAQAILKDIRLT
jgi:glycosyltransferase involved in cell wall biosynthesis